jgi:trimethylamine--corrinoid protein Co-methyltransferase
VSDIRRFPRQFQLEAISPEHIQKIHEASLDVLERVGFSTNSDMLLKRMADEGQKVEFGQGGENGRVWLDPDFVMAKVELAPRHYTLGARNPENDLAIDGLHMSMSTDGCPAHMLDLETGERRNSNKQDIVDITRLADALPQIGLVWQSASASDKIVPVRPMHETHAQWPNTSKHIMQMTAVDPLNARGLLDMLEVLQGSKEAIQERPIMSNFQCIISPLHWDAPPIEALDMLAAAGIPVGICSMPMAAATAPATIAGTIMMANAEILSGVVIMETLNPGSRTFYVSYASTIDMSSGRMNPTWGGEETWLELAGPVMARFYDIPAVHSTMGTGSLAHDWQAGAQNMLSVMGSMVFAGDIMTGAGSLNADSIYSLQGLVLDAEIMEMAYQWVKGFEVTDESLAVETVANVGPGGHFLGEKHTMDHMRDFRRSDVMNRLDWEGWTEAGRPTPEDAAKEKVRQILATHEVDPLPDGVEAELDKIMGAYEKEALENEED